MSYVLSKLTRNSQDYLFSFTGTSRAKTPAFNFALACAVVNQYPVKVTDDQEFFAREIRIHLPSRLSSLHEMIRFDLESVITYATNFYRYRHHNACEKTGMVVVTGRETSVADFFGITRFFTIDDLKMIQDQGQKIVTDILSLESLFRDLRLFDHDGK